MSCSAALPVKEQMPGSICNFCLLPLAFCLPTCGRLTAGRLNLPAVSIVVKLSSSVESVIIQAKEPRAADSEAAYTDSHHGGIMYCPNCAAAYSYGLRYCKQCGTNLGEGPQTSTLPPPAPAPKVTGAAWALAMATVAIVLGGLGSI